MKSVIVLSAILFTVICYVSLLAHDDHDKDKKDTTKTDSVKIYEPPYEDTLSNQNPDANKEVTASFDEFPHLHPLIVHWPIVMLILAAMLQIIVVFNNYRIVHFIILVLLFIGLATAYISTNILHPHTTGLSLHAEKVLEMHEQMAEWTVYLAGLSLLLKLISTFLVKGKKWMELLVLASLISVSVTISYAGHYGAQLVHIEGVGPKGKYLEEDH